MLPHPIIAQEFGKEAFSDLYVTQALQAQLCSEAILLAVKLGRDLTPSTISAKVSCHFPSKGGFWHRPKNALQVRISNYRVYLDEPLRRPI